MAVLTSPLVYNPDDSNGWNQHPSSGELLEDSSDLTYVWNDLTGTAKNCRCFTPYYFEDITPYPPPDDAVVSTVKVTFRTRKDGTPVGVINVTPFVKQDSVQTNQPVYALSAAFSDNQITFATDANGLPWTIPNLKKARFGLRSSGGLASGTVKWAKAELEVAYGTGSPVANATGTSSLTATTATLVGDVDPAGASAGNPVAVDFQYDTSPAFSAPTTVPGTPSGLTGILLTPVTAAITGLTTSTLYYFRIRLTQSAVLYYSNTISFVATPGGEQFGLSEFSYHTPADYPTQRWITRMLSFEFDIASTVDICPDLDFTPLDDEEP